MLANAYDQYQRLGGFPEMILESDKHQYIDQLVHSIITQDIQRRFNVRNIDELRRMASHLLNEAPALIVQDALREICGIRSDHTVVKYLSYLEQTYLISTVSRYSAKSRQRVRGRKYYAIDVALMDKRANAFAGENLGWRLETIIYLELRRRYAKAGYDIYYYKEPQAEADFVVCDGNQALAIYQVSYDIASEKTRQREIRGCITAAKTTRCNNLYVITNSEREDITEKGYTIAVRPAYEWLIGIE